MKALNEAKAYTDQEKAKYLPLTGGTVTGSLNCTASNAIADVNNKELTSYIADIMGANDQLSIIKGDNTTSVISINNVLNATKATQDGTGNVITDTYVKKTGDTLSGILTFTSTNNWLLRRDVNTESALITGGTEWTKSANLQLYGGNHAITPGRFILMANDGTNRCDLDGKPTGELIWKGKNLVRSVNGVNADVQGNVQLGNLGNSGATTGEIKWFAFNTAPDGYLVCNGAQVSRTTYADLFNAIGTTFGSGDGSTTFTLPNLIDKFAQGSTTVGTVKSAGLPNITGQIQSNDRSIGNNTSYWTTSTGALFGEDFSHNSASGGSNERTYMGRIRFNASNANPIYGKSTTVQPPALTLLPCIKY